MEHLQVLRDDAPDTLKDMHRYMIPLLGIIGTVVLLPIILLFAFKIDFARFLRWVLMALAVVQIFICVFFWFNPVWPISLQLILFAMFALFATISKSADHVLLLILFHFFDLFCLLGHVTFLGYSTNFVDAMAFEDCVKYYYKSATDDEPLCASYINYLRFLAFALIFMQALQAFFAYLLWKDRKEHVGDVDHYQTVHSSTPIITGT